MNFVKIKNKILVPLAIAIIALLASFGIYGHTVTSHAAGSAIDYSQVVDGTITLNVNGDEKTSSNYKTDTTSRVLSIQGVTLFSESSTSIRIQSIDLSNTEYFAVEPTDASGAPVDISQAYLIRFTAKKSTAPLGDDTLLPRVKFTYSVGSAEPKSKIFAVKVDSTFVPKSTEDYKNTQFYTLATDPSIVPDISDAIPYRLGGENGLNNYGSYTFSLADVFSDHYMIADGTRAVTYSGTTEWNIHDTTYLRITQIDCDYGITPDFEKGYVEGYYSEFTLNVNVAEQNITDYLSDANGELGESDTPKTNDDFWLLDAHSITLTISDGTSNTDNLFKVKIPFKINPADKPKTRTHFEIERTDLTIIEGQNSVKVYPSDLCSYPTTSNRYINGYSMEFPDLTDFKVYFGGDESKKQGDYLRVAEKPAADELGDGKLGETYWLLTLPDNPINGSESVSFKILYKNNLDQDSTMVVTVSFTVYGAYEITKEAFTLTGNKKTIDTYKSSTGFSELHDNDYMLVDVNVKNKDGSDANGKYISVSISSNKRYIYITPRANCLDGNVEVVLTFTSVKGETIEIKTPLSVDLAASDWFGNLYTWQKVLLCIGIGVGILLVLLLIIWLFVRGIHRRKLDELETSAPTSAYIIKLNSTIAAAQAQQRLATTQAFSTAQNQMLQLGAGPTTQAPGGPTPLQLGGGVPNTANPDPALTLNTVAVPPTTPIPEEQPVQEIIIPISDEVLLQRIYEEKFAPRGMLERTWNKSKDLQSRELDKEKERIRELVRGGMSIEEACKSKAEREGIVLGNTGERERSEEVDPLILILGFDPSEQIVAPETDVQKLIEDNKLEIVADSEEVAKFIEAQSEFDKLSFISNTYAERADKCDAVNEGIIAERTSQEEALANMRDAHDALQTEIDDISVKEASASRREKEKLAKKRGELESKYSADKETISAKGKEIEDINLRIASIDQVKTNMLSIKADNDAHLAEVTDVRDAALSAAALSAERANRAKAITELNRKLETLNPMMQQANELEREILKIEKDTNDSEETKEHKKTSVSTIQTELLSATDSDAIAKLTADMAVLNKEISAIDKGIAQATKVKSDKTIELNGVRRRANEFIDEEQITLEDVITAEDKIIGNIELSALIERYKRDRDEAEEQLNAQQAVYDQLVTNQDELLSTSAQAFADSLHEKESALSSAQTELDEINLRLQLTEDDSEKMDLTIEQMTLTERVNTLTDEFEQLKADGIKANLERKMQGESDIEAATSALETAKAEFEQASRRYDETCTGVDPLDLITSGSGVISRDRKKIEEENLKKKLEEANNAIEQAKIQAQLAQEEADKAAMEAKAMAEASKEEAERLAQEAIAKAEEARLEAERKAQEEAEKAKLEAEEAIRLAQEEAEKAKSEAEESLRIAQEEAEEEKRKAEEVAVEEEKRKAEETAEEEKRKAEEEEAELKRKAEEEAAEAERKARIAEKVAKRKTEVTELRKELKNVTEKEQGDELREKFYAIQLALDEEEKTSEELTNLIAKSMDDASHAAELSHYKKLANQKPRKILKKVTERVNRTPKKKAGQGARPAGARPAGARPRTPRKPE